MHCKWKWKWIDVLPLLLLLSLVAGSELYGDIQTTLEFESLSQTHTNLCQREVPAIFFQTHKNQSVRGNGSSIYFQRIEQCCAGFRTDPYSGQCVPDCALSTPDNCRNGFCRATGQCECFPEFVRNEQGACIHTCPIACQHGRCYLNGTCACQPGYILDPETRLFCRARCPKGCGTHEQCVAPDKCECLPGYRYSPESGCQPICAPDCGYGKCVAPNQCECIPGFIKRRQRNVCEAECYLHCENGFCESRFKCNCRTGYQYDVNTTSCLPVCQDDCGRGNGVCIAPGICRCFEGYELRGNSCEPKCENSCGDYGKCLSPNVCGCIPNEQHCVNGSCDANGHCVCPAGWTHYVGQCLEPQNIERMLSSWQLRKVLDEDMKYEFNALIGRLFNWS